MADTEQFIDVIARAELSRAIESYRAEITLNVRTRKQDACLKEALCLRSDVISALADAGLSPDQIQEGSGSFEQSTWSSSKHNSHVIHVTHSDIKIVVQAMARVEAVFARRPQGFWSPMKHNFTFGAPQPQFVFDPDATGNALTAAIQQAQLQAEALAKGAGLNLAGIISIVQLSSPRPSRPAAHHMLSSVDHFSDGIMDDEIDAPYTPAAPQRDTGTNTYRVRFAATRDR